MDPEIKSSLGDPTWEIVQLFPNQGSWSAADYLALNSNHLIELSDGRLEVLAVPTEEHQLIVAFLYDALKAFVVARSLGTVLFAPLRIQISEGKFREPDVVFLSDANGALRGSKFWRGADLIVEVVSADDPDRDLVDKRKEYAQAGIAEYWIVDPRDHTITVLGLDAHVREYTTDVTYRSGGTAVSRQLAGFAIDVTKAFSQA
jgi:Uma2 family endonuclease